MTGGPNLLEVVITARPSWARVKSLVSAYKGLAGPKHCRITLVGPAISKRYGDISGQIASDVELSTFPTLRDSDDLGSIALSCIEGAEVLARKWSKSAPDCVLVVADRTETLGVSLAASIMQIPLIHLQGGEISGSIDDKVRDANSKLSDFHLTTNVITRKHLLSIGESEERIKVVGCPSLDLLKELSSSPGTWVESDISGVGCEIRSNDRYGIIMFHPDTLDSKQSLEWVRALIEVAKSSQFYWFWFWPNPDHGTNLLAKELRIARESNLLTRVRFLINVTPEAFAKLAINAQLIIGNSSFGIRESSFIGLPAINIGQRQAGRQRGENVLDIENPSSTKLDIAISRLAGKKFKQSNLYGFGDAGIRSAEAILDWTPTVKSFSDKK